MSLLPRPLPNALLETSLWGFNRMLTSAIDASPSRIEPDVPCPAAPVARNGLSSACAGATTMTAAAEIPVRKVGDPGRHHRARPTGGLFAAVCGMAAVVPGRVGNPAKAS
jgi:hypothetical protein